MRQSNVIFGTILLAFIVYITMRGQLPAYLDLFKKGKPTSSSSGSSKSGGGILGGLLGGLGGLFKGSTGGSGIGDTISSLSGGSAGLDLSSISI